MKLFLVMCVYDAEGIFTNLSAAKRYIQNEVKKAKGRLNEADFRIKEFRAIEK